MFNCDESGLYYKLLPQNSLVKSSEKSASGRKTQKERVTISACSNTSGSIKLPLVLIVSAKKSWCFKNVACARHPVSYYNQQNVWVTAALFTNWFHQTFVSTVQAKLVDLGLEPKAVLLIDNRSAHPDEKEFIANDGKVVAKFLLLLP